MGEDTGPNKGKSPKEIIRELVSRYVSLRPKRISLKLDWDDKRSTINLAGDSLDRSVEYSQTVDFTSFARGVMEAYREAYGELEVVPISFREEIYRNDKVSLDVYPTASAGIFDVFVEYRTRDKNE